MKKILITGGPVFAHLDAVKIITNRFRGGLIAFFANQLLSQYEVKVNYICAPKYGAIEPYPHKNLTICEHKGFDDYRRLVLELAPKMDAVVLGAAVANLIPLNPLTGKFPSHNYKSGDIIPINFTIAPRIINEVKNVAPKTQLFGFKLLAGVGYEELIQAAYEIVLDARTVAVFANDADNLEQKYAVTKERGVHPLKQTELASWIWQRVNDKYYHTIIVEDKNDFHQLDQKLRDLIRQFEDRFVKVENDLVFGTVAIRSAGGFATTGRGKKELDEIAYVDSVNHDNLEIWANKKATLNAPLLAKLFENPNIDYIVHYHQQVEGLPLCPYAPSGTIKDSIRPNHTSFNIAGHGCMLLFDLHRRRL